MSVPILIIQTAFSAFRAVRMDLPEAGLVENVDFVLVDNPQNIEPYLDRGKRQLLVTGSFYGDEGAAQSFVQATKESFPKLSAASFSVYAVSGGPYDIHIKKGFGSEFCKDLVRELKSFLRRN